MDEKENSRGNRFFLRHEENNKKSSGNASEEYKRFLSSNEDSGKLSERLHQRLANRKNHHLNSSFGFTPDISGSAAASPLTLRAASRVPR